MKRTILSFPVISIVLSILGVAFGTPLASSMAYGRAIACSWAQSAVPDTERQIQIEKGMKADEIELRTRFPWAYSNERTRWDVRVESASPTVLRFLGDLDRQSEGCAGPVSRQEGRFLRALRGVRLKCQREERRHP